MKKLIRSGLLVAGLSLMLAMPAYAQGAATGNGTGPYNATGVGGTFGNNAYNTGTGRDYMNNGINPLGNNGRYGVNNTGTMNNGRYRTTANADRDFDWGWIGLFGLIGLAGMARNRNPQRER